MTKVAINGFGRIGRLVARAILERPDCGLELVTINDLADAKSNAWLFSRDSVHGKYPGEVSAEGTDLVELLTTTELASSKSDARRALKEGSIWVGNRRIETGETDAVIGPDDLLGGRYLLLRRGKKRYHLVVDA